MCCNDAHTQSINVSLSITNNQEEDSKEMDEDDNDEDELAEDQVGTFRAGPGKWGSCIRVVHPFAVRRNLSRERLTGLTNMLECVCV